MGTYVTRCCDFQSPRCVARFSRTRARLGVRELRLVGAVASDPRKSRSRALCDEVHVLHMEYV